MPWAVSIATGGGIGYFSPFPGTLGSLLGLILFFLVRDLTLIPYSLLLIFLFLLGVTVSTRSESFFQKKDSSHIIIDEIHAMMLVPYCLSQSPFWWLAGLCVFRLFDITKPPPIRILERLPKGWGVMMDDLLAALYTVGSLRLLEAAFRLGGIDLG